MMAKLKDLSTSYAGLYPASLIMSCVRSILMISIISILSINTARAQTLESAEATINSVASQLLELLRTEEISDDEEEGNAQIKAIVEEYLEPVMDFRRLSYRAMGRYYRQATREQFLAFVDAVEQNLINTYASPLIGSDSRQLARQSDFEIRESQLIGDDQDKAVVSTWLIVGNTRYSFVYFLYWKEDDQKWLVENLIAEGINLSVTQRNQFQRLYSDNAGDIDKVIEIWASSELSES